MNTESTLFLTCTDHTVSRETFELHLDKEKEMLLTKPQPKKEILGRYYESDAYISHTDSNKTIFEKVYQFAKNYALKNKIKLVKKESAVKINLHVLDIGCGTGDFLIACKNKNWQVIGVEPNKNASVIATSKLSILNSKVLTKKKQESTILNSIKNIEKNKQFDIITMWHVLEHVPNLTEYISNLRKLLKPNGTLIVAVPNFKSHDAQYYKEHWAAYDVPRHLSHFSQKSIQLLFIDVEMKVVKTIPMKFDAYYVSLLSEKHKTGTPNLLKAFYRGFASNLKARSTKEYSSLIYILKTIK
ncbi:MAG: class I SAM-dependent methyltransferase [Flavobacteriaceae bacterium]|nr:class I SAM-dependent methyltransferase [Flavobacteriaceae bacterium]